MPQKLQAPGRLTGRGAASARGPATAARRRVRPAAGSRHRPARRDTSASVSPLARAFLAERRAGLLARCMAAQPRRLPSLRDACVVAFAKRLHDTPLATFTARAWNEDVLLALLAVSDGRLRSARVGADARNSARCSSGGSTSTRCLYSKPLRRSTRASRRSCAR